MSDSGESMSRHIDRRISLTRLPELSSTIKDSLTAAGIGKERWRVICAEKITAHCSECDETVGGQRWADWLLNLSEQGSPKSKDQRLLRMQWGCCADTECSSGFYNFSFQPLRKVDWSIVPGEEPVTQEAQSDNRVAFVTAARDCLIQHCNLRILLLFVAFFGLWIFRVWHTGGEIPIIRPAKDYSSPANADQYHHYGANQHSHPYRTNQIRRPITTEGQTE